MKIIITAISILLASAPLGGMASAAMLVESGQPRAEIVIAEQPARMTRIAAQELQTYIEKISGATLPIVTAPSGEAARIYVGISPHTKALGIDTEGLKYGAYRMASGPDWLALLGNDRDFEPVEPYARSTTRGSRGHAELSRLHQAWDEITGETFTSPFHSTHMYYHPDLDVWAYDDRGTLHAVYAFLHDLGVRWYMPGELGEVVPGSPDILLPAESRTVRPDFAMRRLWWFYPERGISREDALWRLRLGLHEGRELHGVTQPVHGMKYVHGRPEFREAHPEVFALWGGERATGHKSVGAPCLSSEEMFEKHLAYARAVFDHYGEPALGVCPVDGYAFMCECDDCRGLDNRDRGHAGRMSDYVWGYIDRLARELYRSHPDRLVIASAYSAYRLPPEKLEGLSPNILVRLGASRMSFHDPRARGDFDRLLEAWREKVAPGRLVTPGNVFFNWPRNAWFGLPVYYPRLIAEQLRSLKGVSAGESIECYEHPPAQRAELDWDAQAVAHLAIYTHARLWWDAEQDIDALLDEYYTLFYGPVAAEMKAFVEYCEENWPRMRNEIEPIDRAIELLVTAQNAVDPDSVYGRRIQLVAGYLKQAGPLREQLVRGREGPEARVPRRAAADIVIDGRLDDEFWHGVPEFALADRVTGEAPRVATTLRLAWGDNDSLYLGIYCAEPDIAGIEDTAVGDNDMNVYQGDFIDLLIETPVHAYYQLAFSPSGALLDMDRSRGLHSSWSSGAVAAVHRGDDYWSLEIQLPAAGADARDLTPEAGVSGDRPSADFPWYFNLGRARGRGEAREFSAFSPTGERRFHDRFTFGSLIVE